MIRTIFVMQAMLESRNYRVCGARGRAGTENNRSRLRLDIISPHLGRAGRISGGDMREERRRSVGFFRF